MRLTAAEFLKLRKRRALFWWSLVLTVGLVTGIFLVLEILHLANPGHHGPAGGIDALRGGKFALLAGSSLAAILIGTAAGTSDVSTGVFRDLVATGRSRWQLFLARIPGALALFVPMVTIGYLVVAGSSVLFASSLPAPTASMIIRGYVWLVCAASFDLIVALGFSSLIGSRSVAIGVLIGFQFIAAPILQHVSFLGGARQAVYTAAIDRLDPVPNLAGGEGPPVVIHSIAVAVIVLLVWTAAMLALGGWRTATRDA